MWHVLQRQPTNAKNSLQSKHVFKVSEQFLKCSKFILVHMLQVDDALKPNCTKALTMVNISESIHYGKS